MKPAIRTVTNNWESRILIKESHCPREIDNTGQYVKYIVYSGNHEGLRYLGSIIDGFEILQVYKEYIFYFIAPVQFEKGSNTTEVGF